MKRNQRNNGIWKYLDECGVLEDGTDQDIKRAKKEYRKLYKREYQRKYRANHPEFSISLTQDEEAIITDAAKKHHRSRTAYLKEASLACTRKLYLVPNTNQLARFEQLLSLIHQEVKIIAQADTSPFDEKTSYQGILRRIELLEQEVSKMLRQPPLAALHQSYDTKAYHTSKT